MVKILQPRRVTYATVFMPSVVTMLLSSVTNATCFLEPSWKQPAQRQYIDLVVSIVIYFFTWSSHLFLLCGGRGYSDEFTKWLQRLRHKTLEGRCFITCFYKTFGNENIQSLCQAILTSLPTLNKCVIIATVILSVIIEYRSVPGRQFIGQFIRLVECSFEQIFI